MNPLENMNVQQHELLKMHGKVKETGSGEYTDVTKPLKIKIKKLHPNAVIPTYAKNGDAGMDLTAINASHDEYGNVKYDTGLSFEIPQGYVGLLFPRSSNCKKDLLLTNAVGVIDSGYRGGVSMVFKHTEIPASVFGRHIYQIGDRIGQLIIMPYPQIEFEEVDELSETDRGTGGYGHTGA